MSSNNNFCPSTPADNKAPKRSAPITINSGPRRRSCSVSSSSSGSSNSPTDLPTPRSGSNNRINIPSPSSSPILSYVLAQSPTKSPSAAAATFPFMRKFGAIPAFEVIIEDDRDPEVPATTHARRASTATNIGRFSQQQQQNSTLPDLQTERGTNLLRRLSLSFVKPPTMVSSGRPRSPLLSPTPPNTAVSTTAPDLPATRKPGRSATIGGDGRKPRRAPSPMGERILKGHFDGFN